MEPLRERPSAREKTLETGKKRCKMKLRREERRMPGTRQCRSGV